MNTSILSRSRSGLGAGAAFAALVLGYAPLNATDYTWSVASGFWDTPTNWSPNGAPGALDNVNLNHTAQSSLTLNGTSQSVSEFRRTQTTRVDVLGNAVAASTLTVGLFTNSASGTFAISNGNSPSSNLGGLTVNATNLAVGGGSVFFGLTTATGYGNLLNGLNVSGTTTVSAGSLLMNINGAYSLGQLDVSTGATVSLNNANGLKSSSTTANVAGLSGTGGIIQGAVNTGSVIGNVSNLALNASANFASAATIRDSASGSNGDDGVLNLSKAGVGTQTLSGTNTYTGTTTVTDGVLLVNGSHTNGGAYSVGATGTLGGNGSISASGATFADGAKLDVGGAGVGTLTLALSSGGLDLSAVNTVGSLLFELGAVNSSDKVSLTAGTLNVGTLNFNEFAFTTTGGFGEGTYVLFDAATSVAGTIGQASGMIGGMQGMLAIDLLNDNVVLTVTSIPEPSSVALLLAFAGLCQASVLRRRRVRA